MLLTIQPSLKSYPAEKIDAPVEATKKGLHASWERVNGKLVCRWLKYPD